MSRLPFGVRHSAPSPIGREVGPSCCPKCHGGHNAPVASVGTCVAPLTCPCHKAERIARLKRYTGVEQ